MWNVHNVAHRTNNDVEGWHAAFNKLVAKHHPNLWEFIQALQKQQATVQAMCMQLAAGQRVACKAEKVCEGE